MDALELIMWLDSRGHRLDDEEAEVVRATLASLETWRARALAAESWLASAPRPGMEEIERLVDALADAVRNPPTCEGAPWMNEHQARACPRCAGDTRARHIFPACARAALMDAVRRLASPGAPGAGDGALREVLANLLAVAWPTPDEGHTGFVDRLGMQFYRETGIWPHFKSAPMEIARDVDHAEAARRWSAWLNEKRDAAAAAAARALASPPSEDGVRARAALAADRTPAPEDATNRSTKED